MGKGRPSLLIDKAELEAAIKAAEQSNTFPSVLGLCEAVASSDWASKIKLSNGKITKLNAQNVYNAIRKYDITISTKKVEKSKISTMVGQKRLKGVDTEYLKYWQSKIRGLAIKDSSKDKLHKLVQRAAKGSTKAVIRLHCIDCMGYENTKDIGTEQCSTCPLVIYWR